MNFFFFFANLMGTVVLHNLWATQVFSSDWACATCVCLCSYTAMRTTSESLCFWNLGQPLRTIVLGEEAQTIQFPHLFNSHSLRHGAQSISPQKFKFEVRFSGLSFWICGIFSIWLVSSTAWRTCLWAWGTKWVSKPWGLHFWSVQHVHTASMLFPITKKQTQINRFCYCHSLLLTSEKQGLR